MSVLIDRTGHRHGMLVVQHRGEDGSRKGITRWWCLCDCGKKTLVLGANLTKGRTKSCGCTRAKKIASSLRLYPKHNLADSKKYMAFRDKVWATFRLREDDYRAIMDKQRGCCPICRKGFEYKHYTTGPCIDHDHETGKVRGILCGHCNRALGLFGDTVVGLSSAIRYLEGKDEPK